jgi:hypothetical protein
LDIEAAFSNHARPGRFFTKLQNLRENMVFESLTRSIKMVVNGRLNAVADTDAAAEWRR